MRGKVGRQKGRRYERGRKGKGEVRRKEELREDRKEGEEVRQR